ncbi:CDP-glycerol glycerophosphotransferase family protein [Viscerimonas tarda]
MKKYLLFVSHSYAYSILRPIQAEIWRRGDDAAWYIEDTSPLFLHESEKRLKTIKEVMDYNPVATFAPGNHIYDFFPGIKVEVFHGLYFKRADLGDHYKIRGLFDLYCTTSSLFTPTFKELEKKYGFFKVAETGWSKFDGCMPEQEPSLPNKKPVIIYAPTFTKKLNSPADLYEKIAGLVRTKDWEWLFSFHPKMDAETNEKYRELAKQYCHVSFCDTEDKTPLYRRADVMLSDNSSVVYEFLWFDKPVVTYKNAFPDTHLINISDPAQLEDAIQKALSRPAGLMKSIRAFMNRVHPLRDGKASARILDATGNFIENYQGKLKRKPLNLFRKLKLRKKAGYFPFGGWYRS